MPWCTLTRILHGSEIWHPWRYLTAFDHLVNTFEFTVITVALPQRSFVGCPPSHPAWPTFYFPRNFAQSTQSTCYPTMMMLQYLYLNILGDANTSRRLPCSWLFYHKPRTDFFEPTDLHTVPQLCWSGSATRHGLHLAEGCKIASLVVLWSLAEFQTPRPSAVFFAAEARRRCLCWTSGTRGKHDIYTCLPDRNPPNLAARYRQINCLWHSGPAFAPNADFGQRFEVWRDVTAWDQECNQHLAASGSWKVVRQSATWKI